MDAQGRHRRERPRADSLYGHRRALRVARRVRVCRPCAVSDAIRIRRTRREAPMTAPARSDALVFFGATGDLAYKQIFPALQALVKRGLLNVPIVGVARAGWTLEQFRARAKDSVEHHGRLDRAAFEKLSEL